MAEAPPQYPTLCGIVKLEGGSVLKHDQIVKDDLWFDSAVRKIIHDEAGESTIINADATAKIIDPARRFWEASRLKDYAAHVVFDTTGLIAVPGFIDIQTNGAFGVDFTTLVKIPSTPTREGLSRAASSNSQRMQWPTILDPKDERGETTSIAMEVPRLRSLHSNNNTPTPSRDATPAPSRDHSPADDRIEIPLSNLASHPHRGQAVLSIPVSTGVSHPVPSTTISGVHGEMQATSIPEEAVLAHQPRQWQIDHAASDPSAISWDHKPFIDLLKCQATHDTISTRAPASASNTRPVRYPIVKSRDNEENLEHLHREIYMKCGDLALVGEELPQYGVTSYCPTIISSAQEYYRKAGQQIARYMIAMEQYRLNGGILRQSNIIGMHLEGPFISAPGAHNLNVLSPPLTVDAVYARYCADQLLPFISIVTMAPELAGALEACSALSSHNVVVSMGHTYATIDQGKQAVQHGASLVTHMFNAMRAFHHRDPGLVGFLAERPEDSIHFSLIADGYHAHEYSVRLAYNSNKDKLVLVTDSISAMGLPDGRYKLGDIDIVIRDRKPVLASDPNKLAGAALPLDQCVRNLIKFTGCPPQDAFNAASKHPAQVLGIYPRKGSLSTGADADIVLLDEHFHVVATIINGQFAFIDHDFFLQRVTTTTMAPASSS